MYREEREAVAYFMRRLYRQMLTTTSGGNISCRTADGLVAITASQSDKAEQRADQVGIVRLDGTTLTPHLKLSIETGLHLAIYRARPDVAAIVHAHPVTATFFCATEETVEMRLTAEAYAVVGKVVRIPYAIMGSPQLAELVGTHMREADCGLMENHGVVAVGTSLLNAFDKLELVEAAAKQTLMAHIVPAKVLTPDRLVGLDKFMGRK